MKGSLALAQHEVQRSSTQHDAANQLSLQRAMSLCGRCTGDNAPVEAAAIKNQFASH